MRALAVIVGALVVNAMLLLVMERMIGRDRVRPMNLFDAQTIEFVRTKPDEQDRTKDRRRKLPPKPQETKRPKARLDDLLSQTMELPAPVQALDIQSILGVGGIGIGQRLVDGDAVAGGIALDESHLTPISKLPPQYPPGALARGLQGTVKLLLHVTAEGTVSDVEVLEADFGNVFTKSAIAAASRWRYRPLIQDGVARAVRVVVSVDYELQ